MNRIFLTGRTVKELELKSTQGGTYVCKFTLAVDRRGKDKGTDFVPCVAFGKLAELLNQYVSKGNKIGVIGHLQTGSYDRDGKKVYTADVILDELEFLEKKSENFTPIQNDGDLPF